MAKQVCYRLKIIRITNYIASPHENIKFTINHLNVFGKKNLFIVDMNNSHLYRFLHSLPHIVFSHIIFVLKSEPTDSWLMLMLFTHIVKLR